MADHEEIDVVSTSFDETAKLEYDPLDNTAIQPTEDPFVIGTIDTSPGLLQESVYNDMQDMEVHEYFDDEAFITGASQPSEDLFVNSTMNTSPSLLQENAYNDEQDMEYDPLNNGASQPPEDSYMIDTMNEPLVEDALYDAPYAEPFAPADLNPDMQEEQCVATVEQWTDSAETANMGVEIKQLRKKMFSSPENRPDGYKLKIKEAENDTNPKQKEASNEGRRKMHVWKRKLIDMDEIRVPEEGKKQFLLHVLIPRSEQFRRLHGVLVPLTKYYKLREKERRAQEQREREEKANRHKLEQAQAQQEARRMRKVEEARKKEKESRKRKMSSTDEEAVVESSISPAKQEPHSLILKNSAKRISKSRQKYTPPTTPKKRRGSGKDSSGSTDKEVSLPQRSKAIRTNEGIFFEVSVPEKAKAIRTNAGIREAWRAAVRGYNPPSSTGSAAGGPTPSVRRIRPRAYPPPTRPAIVPWEEPSSISLSSSNGVSILSPLALQPWKAGPDADADFGGNEAPLLKLPPVDGVRLALAAKAARLRRERGAVDGYDSDGVPPPVSLDSEGLTRMGTESEAPVSFTNNLQLVPVNPEAEAVAVMPIETVAEKTITEINDAVEKDSATYRRFLTGIGGGEHGEIAGNVAVTQEDMAAAEASLAAGLPVNEGGAVTDGGEGGGQDTAVDNLAVRALPAPVRHSTLKAAVVDTELGTTTVPSGVAGEGDGSQTWDDSMDKVTASAEFAPASLLDTGFVTNPSSPSIAAPGSTYHCFLTGIGGGEHGEIAGNVAVTQEDMAAAEASLAAGLPVIEGGAVTDGGEGGGQDTAVDNLAFRALSAPVRHSTLKAAVDETEHGTTTIPSGVAGEGDGSQTWDDSMDKVTASAEFAPGSLLDTGFVTNSSSSSIAAPGSLLDMGPEAVAVMRVETVAENTITEINDAVEVKDSATYRRFLTGIGGGEHGEIAGNVAVTQEDMAAAEASLAAGLPVVEGGAVTDGGEGGGQDTAVDNLAVRALPAPVRHSTLKAAVEETEQGTTTTVPSGVAGEGDGSQTWDDSTDKVTASAEFAPGSLLDTGFVANPSSSSITAPGSLLGMGFVANPSSSSIAESRSSRQYSSASVASWLFDHAPKTVESGRAARALEYAAFRRVDAGLTVVGKWATQAGEHEVAEKSKDIRLELASALMHRRFMP